MKLDGLAKALSEKYGDGRIKEVEPDSAGVRVVFRDASSLIGSIGSENATEKIRRELTRYPAKGVEVVFMGYDNEPETKRNTLTYIFTKEKKPGVERAA